MDKKANKKFLKIKNPFFKGIPLNIKMTPMSTGRRILSEGEKEQIIFPPSQNNENEIIEKIQKRVKNKENLIEEEEIEEEKEEKSFCKDTHELCCFWAVAGECNNNPFWMRVKCPMTCGTCGCKGREKIFFDFY